MKYMHHVVWRQLDPPSSDCHGCFKPTEFSINCSLPIKKKVVKDPKIFRKNLQEIRKYFSENLVIPVHQSLSSYCQKFVSENRLKYGDVIMYLALQDSNSRSLELTAKQIIFKKWKVRERMSLIRTLVISKKLVKLSLPGKIDDEMLKHIGRHCRNLEELDISTSYITDKGLMAICGVWVEDVKEESNEDLLLDVLKENLSENDTDLDEEAATASGSGRRKRKAAIEAKTRVLDMKKNSIGYLRKLAIGQTVSKELEESFSLLASKMKPYIDKRLQQGDGRSLPWRPTRGHLYKFNSELSMVFMSCNLVGGMFQRLEKMKKNAFASAILFGENNNSSISGIWVWKGQELAFDLCEDWAIDSGSYDWKKLDPKAEETKALVAQYWKWEGNDLEGRKFNQGKILK